MIRTIASQWRSIDWRQLILSVAIQSVIWWYVPMQYATQISTSTFEFNLAFIFLYQIAVAASSFILFSTNFSSHFAVLTIIASGILAFSGAIHGKFVIILLLLLLPAYLFIVQIKKFQLQNEYGLLLYGILAAITIPITLVFLTVHFLSWTFIASLFPLMLTYFLFLAPIFLEDHPQKAVIISMAAGILLIILLLFKSISLPSILAIALSVVSWFIMNNLPKLRSSYLTYSFIQMLVVLLIYWA
ncbi:hypothetical protein ABTQ33_04255 [Paucilactobacillus suebicus]|uniref:Integral membrane protein n=1 Tax=Paucilactobacillus suebicus DSM 5007 = KCTC 3549 TaxID=1423807 RepID=A0A0R1W510_9LACO|nr:hypothetical protein [Paucilactobacillus suebicus]KRM10729.1 hypothetical protein FD16_GL001121 [Paucilactobacillus suebicus DSM 5007 = KCTC 3549]